jgi:hypothetical protein
LGYFLGWSLHLSLFECRDVSTLRLVLHDRELGWGLLLLLVSVHSASSSALGLRDWGCGEGDGEEEWVGRGVRRKRVAGEEGEEEWERRSGRGLRRRGERKRGVGGYWKR